MALATRPKQSKQTASKLGVNQLRSRDRVSTAGGVSSTRAQRGLAVSMPESVSQLAYTSDSKQQTTLDIRGGAGHPRWSADVRGGRVLGQIFCI